jgi:uncharacterized DUF497 family protein
MWYTINVHSGDFDWDPIKAADNEQKHGVTFEEASQAVVDPNAYSEEDPTYEERRRVIGQSDRGRTLFVVVIEEDQEGVTRIISARKANKKERQIYEDGQ